MSGAGSGRRAVARWALRMFRREWRQQVLVLALLTVAVGAAVAGATVAINAASDSAGRFGSGGARVSIDGGDGADPAGLAAQVDATRARVGTVDVIAHVAVPVPGSVRTLDVRDQDPHGAYSAPMLALVTGRFPTAAGEVALTRSAASLLGTSVGSSATLIGPATVVGIVENPAQLNDVFALVAPRSITEPTSITVLVDQHAVGQGGTSASSAGSTPLRVEIVGTADDALRAAVLVATTLALALVALIASAGFVVVAQRHQRQLGLLSAIGASARQVRLVVVTNGVIVALTAALVGGMIGIGGWFLAAPAVETAANHRIDRLDLPWGVVGAIVLMAIVMSTLAAWWPARMAARQPVMVALSGRPSRPRPTRRSLLVAAVFLGGGLVSIVFAQATTRNVRPMLLVSGLLAVIVGAVFVAPAAVRTLGPLARRLPFPSRLALRDLARYQARAAAALAAITLGLGVAVGVIILAAASENPADSGNLSEHEMLIVVDSPEAPASPEAIVAETASLDARAGDVAAVLGTGTTAVPLDLAYTASVAGGSPGRPPAMLGIRRSANSIEGVGVPFVATPEVLALYGIDPADIDANVDLLTTRTEPMLLLAPPALQRDGTTDKVGRPDFDAPPVSTQIVDLPTWSSAPNSLITESAMRRNGWVAARRAWIIESPHGFTSAQISAARTAAATAGLSVETRDEQDSLKSVRSGATVIGALLAMAIVAMTVGLIRGESAADIRTMTATGASARTRRAVTASTAAALAALGVLLAIASAYAAIVAAYHGDLVRLVPLPMSNLLTLVIGLPVTAAVAGWLLAGREPRTFSRQSLD